MIRSFPVQAILVSLVLLASSSARADLRCDRPTSAAGEVRGGSVLVHRFPLLNPGPGEVDVTDLGRSCGCLKPQITRRHYEPGETGEVVLEVNTLVEPAGPHAWQIRVRYRCDGQDHDLVLSLVGHVIPEVHVQPAALILSTDSGIGHTLTLTTYRPHPLPVTAVEATSAHVHARLGEAALDPAGHWTRTIQLEVLPSCPEGRHEEEVHILTADLNHPELRVPLTVVKRSPRTVRAVPEEVILAGALGQPLPARIVLLGTPEGQEVGIEKVEADHPAVSCRWAPGPGPRATLRIHVDHQQIHAEGLNAQVRVHLRQPASTTLVIPVRCQVR